ncbi:MAG: VWA domain-containing protein [Pseudomonadota bacterium]
MAKRGRNSFWIFVLVGFGFFAANNFQLPGSGTFGGLGGLLGGPEPVEPDWAAITAWPGQEAEEVEAQPDPNRTFTAIVLDDSGSMGGDIEPAKAAVLQALSSMSEGDRVAVIALNDGVILPFMSVGDAKSALPAPLARVTSDGSTPLTASIQTARRALAAEAARVGGFGTFRILVTTDGQADDGAALRGEIEDLARVTPIQVATIGVGIDDRHVLSRPDLAAFVTVSDISGLGAALQSAIAEEQNFSAITSFEAGGE